MAQNVRPGRLDFSEARQLVDPPLDNRDRGRSQIRPGDLLITIVGANTGDLCPVTEELAEHFVCQSVALLRLVTQELQPFVLRYFLRGAGGRKALEDVIYGQGRPHLGFDDLKLMAVPLAPMEEQLELLRVIRSHENTIDGVQSSAGSCLDELDTLDQTILAKAFRGELVPQDPADEPAAALLARIKAGVTATRSVERGRVKFYILLLLRTWNKPLSREMLERGLVLMLNADVRRAILGRSKPAPKRGKKSGTPPKFVTGLDVFLGEMLDDGDLVPGPEAGFFAEGQHDFDLAAAPKADLDAVRETAEAMKVIHKDKLQATDADIVSALHGEVYELVS